MIRRQRNALRFGNREFKSDQLFGCFNIVVTSQFQYDSIVLEPVILETFSGSFAAWRNKDEFVDLFKPLRKVCQKLCDNLAFQAARFDRSSDNHQFTRGS